MPNYNLLLFNIIQISYLFKVYAYVMKYVRFYQNGSSAGNDRLDDLFLNNDLVRSIMSVSGDSVC
jgi:hypothetical protein